MASPREMKKKIRQDVIASLEQAEAIDLEKTVAMFSLETGFNDRTVRKILKQMEELGYITMDGNVISRPENAAAQQEQT